jgi:hypothetical protein
MNNFSPEGDPLGEIFYGIIIFGSHKGSHCVAGFYFKEFFNDISGREKRVYLTK